jgi:hypothetical protein
LAKAAARRKDNFLAPCPLPVDFGQPNCGAQKFKDSSSSTVQESVLAVKSVEYGLRHHSTWSVETMPLALEPDGEILNRIGKAGPQRRVRSAAIVMRSPSTQSFSQMLLG